MALLEKIEKSLASDNPDPASAREKLRELRREILADDEARRALLDKLEKAEDLIGRLRKTGTVAGLEIHFYSRLADTDGDGRPDVLTMAVSPKDTLGNPLKAPGSFTFELCKRNLLGRAGKVLQSWSFKEDEISEHWRGQTVVFPCYEFSLPVKSALLKELGREGFVRVTFTPVLGPLIEEDYLVGVKK